MQSASAAPRVIALLPAATDILAALGGSNMLVGVTHECDLPAGIAGIPRVTSSPIVIDAPAVVDQQVREAAHEGRSLFTLNEALIASLRPTLLITQALCEVCAVNEDDVRALAKRLDPQPEVVTLNGTTFDGVFDDIARVAAAVDMVSEGEELLAGLQVRLRTVQRRIIRHAPESRPRVVVIEWTDPVYLAGHWVPDILWHAGGVDALIAAGSHSRVHTIAEIAAAAPEVLLIAPCGYNVNRAATEGRAMLSQPAWQWARNLPAYAIDANALTSRPGPNVVSAVEVIASALWGHTSQIEASLLRLF